MRVVLATTGFAEPGGSEVYLLVVAEQLQRLGHQVMIRAIDRGAMADTAAARGIDVAESDDQLPDGCDVVLVQDAPSAYELADRWPGTPQVFRACSDVFDFQLPPGLPGVVGCVVTCSDRVTRRVRAMDGAPEVVRLRHPVDVRRFSPTGRISERPRQALLLGNYLAGERLEVLTAAWESRGVRCVQLGHHVERTLAPEIAMNRADIVVGKARVVIEAMACGRAAYVYDSFGRDGWITPERYAAMEADNFAGHATGAGLDPDEIAADLDDYDAAMGDRNRDLALRHHHAARHAEQLVELFRRVSPGALPAATPALELARLARSQWASEGEALLLRQELDRKTDELRRQYAAVEAVHERYRPAEQELEALYADREVVRAERDAARQEAERLRRELDEERRRGSAMGRVAGRLRGRA